MTGKFSMRFVGGLRSEKQNDRLSTETFDEFLYLLNIGCCTNFSFALAGGLSLVESRLPRAKMDKLVAFSGLNAVCTL